MAKAWMDLIAEVTDEKSFLRFLAALREDYETHERDCPRRSYFDCASADHWETTSIKDFLKSAEEWGGGDFADGEHYGEPLLRRVATLLFAGRHIRPDDRPYGK
jgi:hypothetical protein